jgi:hypothetical protein
MRQEPKAMPTRKILGAYKAGLSVRAVAKLFGVDKDAAHRRIKRAGLSRPNPSPGPPRRTPNVATLCALRDAGASQVEVARACGLSRRAVGDIWRTEGDGPWGRCSHRRRPDVPLYRAGMTLVELARQFGCCTRTISLRLDEAGEKRRPKGYRWAETPPSRAPRYKECECCGGAIAIGPGASRRSRKTCSNACRQRLCRERKASAAAKA